MQQGNAVDMSPIMEALRRRQQGQLGGGGLPMQAQVSQPQPGAGAPVQQPAPMSQPAASDLPQQVRSGALKSGQQAQGPQFDEETRVLAKSLVQRLLKGI